MLTAAGTIIGAGLAITQLPKLPTAVVAFTRKVLKDPASLKEIPEAISRGGAEFGQLLRISPTEALVKIGTEILIMKGIGKALKVTGAVTSKAAARLSPKFKGVIKRTISIPSLQKGKTLTIKVSSKIGRGRIPSQLRFAGERTTAVSAQADRLVKIIKTRKIIRKPIPGEAKLTKATKKLLKKFDEGKITSKELIHLDRRIRVEAKKGLLERSFFADPEGVVRKRFLRLGTEKEASLLDVLSGDVTFKTSRPQILVFEKVKVEAFPKTKIFKSITKKLKTGKVLTQKESGALVKFQLKKTGKFKPLGFQTTEMELTLSPGEIVKKVKTIAVTIIDGKRVPIVRAVVVKAKPMTKKLLGKAKKGKLTASELKTLRKNLKKETGFASSISDSMISKPRLPLGRKAISVAIRAKSRRPPKRIPPRKIPIRRPPKKPPVRRPPKKVPRVVRLPRRPPKKPPVRRPPKKVPRVVRPPRRPPRRPPLPPPTKPPIPRMKIKRIPKKKPKPKPRSYHVYAKPLKKKKLVRVTRKPIKKQRAEDLRNYISDTSLSRTAKTKPSTQKPAKPYLRVPVGYSPRTKRKFRTYRIVRGKRIALRPGKVIERSKHLLDTPQEKRRITLLARIAQMQRKAARKKTSHKSNKRRTTIVVSPRARRKSIHRTTKRTPKRKSFKRKNPVKRRRRSKGLMDYF